MKHWRCEHCWKPGVDEAEWEDHLTQSFCRMCGGAATRVYEFGCFACDDQGVMFWAEEAPSHPCPDCASPAYRIVHAPYVRTSEKRADYAAADKMLETELSAQNLSSTTLKREVKAPTEGLGGGWVSPNQVMGRAMPGSQVSPLGTVPRPMTTIVGTFDKKAG